jgi:hypothetical protein
VDGVEPDVLPDVDPLEPDEPAVPEDAPELSDLAFCL